MKKRNQIFIFIGASLLVVAILLFWFQGKQKKFDWKETYHNDSAEPFGSSILFQLLEDKFEEYGFHNSNGHFVFKQISTTKKPAAYVFVGNDFNANPSKIDNLLAFAKKGNQVFVSANKLPRYLFNKLEGYNPKVIRHINQNHGSSAIFNLSRPEYNFQKNLEFPFIVKGEKQFYPWSYFDYQSEKFEELGTISSSPNFIRYSWGNGSIFLHTNPILFTNYNLVKNKGFEYASRVFMHLEPSEIFWDEGSKRNLQQTKDNRNNEALNPKNTPLSWFLSKDNFRYAWYLLLLMGLLYLIFRAKRRQPLVPVILQNTDTSLLFARLVGKLYLKQGNHRNLANHKIKHFYIFIRGRYKMAKPQSNNSFMQSLSTKSGIEYNQIQEIFEQIKIIEESKKLSEKFLIDFHNLLYMFYLKCK